MNNNLPSLHEQSPYRTQQYRPPPANNVPEHYNPTSSGMYESRKLFTCNEPGCSEYFDQPGGLRIHQRNAHGRGVGGSSAEQDHMRSSQTRPYVCPYAECGKSFTQYGNLKTHSRKHTGERPYHCTYDGCDKAFTQLGNLKTHEKIHWPVKPFMCAFPNCGKGFTQRGNLKTHQVKVHQIVPQ
ncbi:hypothetical protein HPULCUR_011490 [Helicostylum pulchrum]|uniref:C2H2-type domain-containing protein n=1 Tax=Helicostylum pulchrum TaxID=562976 RepID=A0ABP9YG83_9FUNG